VNALERAERDAAIDAAERALASAETPDAIASLRSTLLHAHAARAHDARHGANQLSLGAQRAPTTADCDDGWQRVEEIVTVAESSAAAAALLASLLDTPSARKLAHAAQTAAHAARRLVDARNHAYTFHADPSFSFGEGWYLAAAAVLAGVTIQIEPSKPQTAQAEHFLHAAGLAPLLQPYRSRPRANKHLPEIVARVFRADPLSAQRTLRRAFLGTDPIPQPIIDWIDARVSSSRPKVLLWVRHGGHHPARNTTHAELISLTQLTLAAGLVPILVGDALRDPVPPGALDLTLFWKDPLFQGVDMRRAQLHFFEHLRHAHALVGQLGVTTAGMDGPALLGLPTLYLTAAPNPRLGTWVGAVPGYTEVVRTTGYLDPIAATLQQWRDDRTAIEPTLTGDVCRKRTSPP
jgi:hypothetical protein